MRMRILWLCVFILITPLLRAQCNYPQVSVISADKLCRDSPVRLLNEDNESQSYYWDFCPEVFREQALLQTNSITGFQQGHGYKLVEDDGLWYGFMVSRSLDKIFRLDFGSDPGNRPLVTDLGNPGGLMDAPEGIDIYKDGSDWFAFIGKGDNSFGQVVKLHFGSDLTSIPSATGYGTFGLGSIRIRDLLITKEGDNIILILLIYNTASINRVSFGNTLHNAPGANNMAAIPGALLPRGIELLTDCSPRRAHIVCENGSIRQITFADNILGPISAEGNFTFPSVVQPWKIKSVFSGGKYFSVISNNGRKYTIIDFGDLSLATPPVEVTNANDVRLIGMDVVKYNGKSFVQGIDGTNVLSSISYQNSCNASQEFSYEKSPTIRYHEDGTYQIDLTGFKTTADYSSTSLSITIIDADAPQLKISSTGMCEANDVTFSASNASLISSWAWDFGNGSISYSTAPVTRYSSPGSFNVTLTAESKNSCFAGDEAQIKIYARPITDFELPSGLLCTNNNFTFPATIVDVYDGHLSYAWYTENEVSGTTRDLNHTFTTTGPKEIRLKTSIPGCSEELVKTTSSLESGPIVDFSFTGSCQEETFSFKNEIADPVESFVWSFGTGETTLDNDPAYAFPLAGEYLVSLSATNSAGCETVKAKTVTVQSKPLVDFSAEGPPNACSGNETYFINETINPDGQPVTEWLWVFNDPGDPASANGLNATHVYKEAGSYDVSLTATTADGCVGSMAKEVIIYPSPSTDHTATAACEDVPVLFSSPVDADIHAWYWEIGTSYYYTASPLHTFAVAGDYPLYAEFHARNGCISTVKRTVHVPVPLTPEFSVIKNCVGEEAVFTDVTTGIDPVASRRWTFADGVSSSSAITSHIFRQQGTEPVALQLSTSSGCSYKLTRQITIVQPPRAEFSPSSSQGAYPLEVTFTNSSSGATSFLWEFDDGTSSASTEGSPQHIFSESGDFTVRLTAMNAQQCEDSFSQNISTIAPLPDVEVEVINFVPNADGSGKLIVTINNKGNTMVKDLPVVMDFEGKLLMEQTIPGAILPATPYNFIFTTSILNHESLRYLCVSLDLENDVVPEDNRSCREFEEQLYVLPVYPNPASELVTLEWIATSTKIVHVWLRDAVGRTVLRHTLASSSGLNTQSINVTGLPDGVYFLMTDDGMSKSTQRIMIFSLP